MAGTAQQLTGQRRAMREEDSSSSPSAQGSPEKRPRPERTTWAHLLEADSRFPPDVEFLVREGNVRVPAHTLILSKSVVFATMFTTGFREASGDASQPREVTITEASPDAFRTLVRYFYTGVLELPKLELTESGLDAHLAAVMNIASLANRYEVLEARAVCERELSRHVNENTCWQMYEAVLDLNMPALASECSRLISSLPANRAPEACLAEMRFGTIERLVRFESLARVPTSANLFRRWVLLQRRKQRAQRQEGEEKSQQQDSSSPPSPRPAPTYYDQLLLDMRIGELSISEIISVAQDLCSPELFAELQLYRVRPLSVLLSPRCERYRLHPTRMGFVGYDLVCLPDGNDNSAVRFSKPGRWGHSVTGDRECRYYRLEVSLPRRKTTQVINLPNELEFGWVNEAHVTRDPPIIYPKNSKTDDAMVNHTRHDQFARVVIGGCVSIKLKEKSQSHYTPEGWLPCPEGTWHLEARREADGSFVFAYEPVGESRVWMCRFGAQDKAGIRDTTLDVLVPYVSARRGCTVKIFTDGRPMLPPLDVLEARGILSEPKLLPCSHTPNAPYDRRNFAIVSTSELAGMRAAVIDVDNV